MASSLLVDETLQRIADGFIGFDTRGLGRDGSPAVQ